MDIQGFSLLEVILAILIVSTVLVYIAQLQVIALKGANKSLQQTIELIKHA